MTLQMDFSNEDNAEFYQDYMYQIFEYFASIVKNGNPNQFDFVQNIMQLMIQMQQLLSNPHGKVSGEVIYSGICQFLLNLVLTCQRAQQPQLLQNVFIPQIMEIVRSADSLVDDIEGYEDLRVSVDGLIEILKKAGMYQ